jgi:beta-lactamase superfamily II metal-dependent hydrolase
MPAGERILVDGGGVPGSRYDVGLRRVVPALRRAGVHRLDAVIATHGDADHVQGLFAVLEEIEVDLLIVGSRRGMRSLMRSLVGLAERAGVAVHALDEGLPPPIVEAPGRLRWHHPLAPLGGDWSENDRSVVFSASLGDVVALLPGDLEERGEAALLGAHAVPRAAILKVPHHGSRTSSTGGFLDAVDPLVGLAGAGEGNRFGFPHASTAARYLRRGAPLFWTGRHGSIRACTDGWTLDVDALDRRGRVHPLRRWSAQEVSAWVEEGREHRARPRALGEQVGPAMKPTPPKSTKKRRKRTRPRKKKTKKKQAKKRTEKAESKALPPEEDPLLDDRTWDRHRRRRSRLRAPWKSSRGGSR